MPIHRFRCEACGHEQDELFIRSTDDPDKPEEPCEKCSADPSSRKRLMSAPTPHFVGPGWGNTTEIAPGWSAQVHKGVSREQKTGE